jgi:hypothetical protein
MSHPVISKSVKRYRKSTKLSQNDDKRIIRIINGLKERK